MSETVLKKSPEEKACPLSDEFCALASGGCSRVILEDGCKPEFIAGSDVDVVSRRLLMAGVSPETSVRITEIFYV